MKFTIISIFLILGVQIFSQPRTDTINVKKTYILSLSSEFTVDTINTDTNFFHIHQYEEFFNAYGINLGNGVSAFYNFQYEYLPNLPFWLNSFDIYYKPLKQRYFHTHVPFTQIRLIANTNRTYNEEIVKILHTQNINKNWNIAFEGMSNKKIGKIPRQDNRFHYLYSSTNYQSDRYYLWANYYYSKIKSKENGGVKAPSFLTDSLFPPENSTVFLEHANNRYVLQNMSFKQWYSLNKTDSISLRFKPWLVHQTSVNRAKKVYEDSPLDTLYYNKIYYDSTKTYDSLFYQLQKHALGFSLAQHPLKGSGLMFLVNHFQRKSYSYNFPLKELGWSANISFWKKGVKNTLYAQIEYGFNGFLNNTFNADIQHRQKIKVSQKHIQWQNRIMFTRKEPDVFENHFNSNHYQWNQNLPFKTKIHLESLLKNENDILKIWATNASNAVYFNLLQEPKVIKNIMVSGLEFSKLLNWKNVFSYYKLLVQVSNDTNIRIPAWVTYYSLYYQNKLFKKVLTIQIGADVWIHSKYKPVGYSPVLNAFYATNSGEVGLYPVTNVFLNVSLKRARFFVKMEHLNYQWRQSNFFLINNYSLPSRMLKFGIFWNFYD